MAASSQRHSIPYTFRKLSVEDEEVRILNLLPGKFDDPLEGELLHASLRIPVKGWSSRMSLDQLRETLPSGWDVYEAMEGRYIFQNTTTKATTWTHPDPNVLPSAYEYRGEASLEYEPKFEALSYAWGSIENPESLIVRDHSTNGSVETEIPITKNLATALRHLRYPEDSRALWIDAVCINQQDFDERNKQVPRMRHIYPLASRVVFWLGLATESSSRAISVLRHLGEQVVVTQNSWYLPAPDTEEPSWYYPPNGLPYDDATWQALTDFFGRSWFSRLWPVQECLLANHRSVVQCGRDEVLWSVLRRAARCLRSKDLSVPLLPERVNAIHDTLFSRRTPLGTFTRSRARKCTDIHDKVYGVLSLGTETFSARVPVDYSRPVAEVYRDGCVALMNHTQRVDTLRYAQIGQADSIPGLPSWVPNWDSSDIDYYWCGPLADRPASSISRAHFEFEGTSKMCVVGSRVATIRYAGEPLTSDILQWPRVIRNAWSHVFPEIYPTGEPMLDGFVSTCIMGQDKETYPTYPFPTYQEWMGLFKSVISPIGDGGGVQNMLQEYKRSFGSWLPPFSIVTTNEGFILLTDCKAQPGDIICVLLGGYGAMVLRPDNTCPGQCIYIGCGYVHGLMDGEAFLGPIPPRYRVQIKRDVDDSWGYENPHFLDVETGEFIKKDPRLGPVPDIWEELMLERTPDDPRTYTKFRNKITGEVINSDPRLFPAALEERGVKLETFSLV